MRHVSGPGLSCNCSLLHKKACHAAQWTDRKSELRLELPVTSCDCVNPSRHNLSNFQCSGGCQGRRNSLAYLATILCATIANQIDLEGCTCAKSHGPVYIHLAKSGQIVQYNEIVMMFASRRSSYFRFTLISSMAIRQSQGPRGQHAGQIQAIH